MPAPDRTRARQLANEAVARGDATGWFEQLYGEASGDAEAVPWADMRPNPNFLAWAERSALDGTGKRAADIGCGLGDNAEELARRGFEVVAFDVSKTAIEWCRQRFPESSVDYEVADLLALPLAWQRAMAFVLETYTIQVLQGDARKRAMDCIAGLVARGGTLLVIARGRDEADPPGQMPWPLLKSELDRFKQAGLEEVAYEDFVDDESPPVRRFLVEYRRPRL
jgi:SAM-dependent methyltransferase